MGTKVVLSRTGKGRDVLQRQVGHPAQQVYSGLKGRLISAVQYLLPIELESLGDGSEQRLGCRARSGFNTTYRQSSNR